MIKDLNAQQVAEQATTYFGEDYHCAEAVVAALFEAMGEDASDAIAHATAFGGGFGRTFTEACGVLSGSMIVIGHLYGRRQKGESWDTPAALGETVRQLFVDRHGSSNCGVLRDRFGEEQQMPECRKLVQETTIALINLLQNSLPSAK